MPVVKNRNIRIRNPRFILGILVSLFFTICTAPTLNAQVRLDFNKWQTLQNNNSIIAFAKQQSKTPFNFSSKKTNTTFKSVSNLTVRSLPNVYEYNELGFFCKLDLRMDKTMYMPFRFRLGNLEYVNKLEGYWR